MIDKLDKNQIQNVAKTLKTPAQRQRFNSSVNLAIQTGLIDAPSGQANAGQ
jgi:ribosomal protein L1